MNKLWLPEGAHHDLNIEHDRGQDAGRFTGGGWKLCWHITVSPWMSVDSMVRVLKDKNAAPHLVIGGRPGFRFPVVVQMLPFNRAGRALANTGAPGETNRANVIQVEICARPGGNGFLPGELGSTLFDLPGLRLPVEAFSPGAAPAFPLCMSQGDVAARAFNDGVAAWTDDTYKALANMLRWVENRVPIPRRLAARFDQPRRLTASEFRDRAGHLGHVHVPENTHWDPTPAFRGKRLLRLAATGPHEL